ncbi:glycosyltransferase [uncultured Duncaniella sp.]|jgi:glycosyltransferase involved in cell wall biosynthesis|uniref:glycosyltransferase n=1 Tax=uncultured Duncaniella sp. TaxID=2768039 RepID=UPI0026F39142|nr:glycosyltransferase [uncultured Duncaniella sp.]
MTIVQINAVYEYSSTGRTTKEMHDFFISNGDNSYVFCTNQEKIENNIFKIGNTIDYKSHALGSRLLGTQGKFSSLSTHRLVRQLKSINPDIVILRNLHANYINLPILLSFLAKFDIPTIIVLHDCWFFTGHCCYYTDDNCYKWKTECNHCPILHKYNKSLIFDRTNHNFTMKKRLFEAIPRLGVVGVSDWVLNEAKQSLLKCAKIKKRIYNWIDLSVFRPYDSNELRSKLGLHNDFVILGVAQFWNNEKGLQLFKKLAKEFPNCKIVLVGGMDSSEKLPTNIIAVGILSGLRELAEHYSMADVFLNPSVQETFGKVSAEALACGTPIIANNATANPELVGNCGFVVDNNDFEQFKTAISNIMAIGKKSLSSECVTRANLLFNKARNLKEYQNIMSDLSSLGSSKRSIP